MLLRGPSRRSPFPPCQDRQRMPHQAREPRGNRQHRDQWHPGH
ncbi:hypothetical protein MCHI_002120 [Candidatus Magnetoovum chiemensis]|nr:hypothetical protein MCHI_002120 [Candidatus Magnetoovum chiemensis]